MLLIFFILIPLANMYFSAEVRAFVQSIDRSFVWPSICIGSLIFTNHNSQALIIIMAYSLVSKHIFIYFKKIPVDCYWISYIFISQIKWNILRVSRY